MTNENGFFEKFFKLKEHGTNVSTEVIAGFTTFMTMAYILIVNPLTLADAGMDFGAVFTATALSALIATLVMAFMANLPFVLAPGMGLNAFFAYSVVLGMGYSWQFALTAVFLEGIIFLILTFFNVREAIVDSIPANIKKAVSVGIGLFIAFIGLKGAGIIVDNPATFVQLGDLTSAGPLLTLIGLFLTGMLLAKRVKGALFIGIFATTIIGFFFGITKLPSAIVSAPPAPVMFAFEFDKIFTFDMFIVLFTFLFVDMFDTIGTLVGVSTKAKMLDENGKLPKIKMALFADAVGTTVGACLGTSTVTTYVESAAGVAEGGRTGLTGLVSAGLFAVALFFSPLFIMIPVQATAPALVLVGLFMMSPIKEIDFEDFTEAIPSFLTIIMMPLTFSIAEGILAGIVSYAVIKPLSGRGKEVPIVTYVVAVLFVLKIIFK
ncbi:MAG: guanine permease [Bacteroidetes bacterium 4572_77]|nr:MAG: guanine permease [Bacteroidetes bacterium 4572_77]